MELTERHSKSDLPFVRIDASNNQSLWELRELWQHRELLYFLIWREIKIRYKQTAIGIAWALLQPLLTMLIFAIVFGHFAKMPSDGVPYSVFAYTALLPWGYFAQAVSRSGSSLVGDASLIRKVYFPRLILPLAAVIVPLVDFILAFCILVGMIFWFNISPTWTGLLMLPIFLIMALATALAVGLWLSPLNVKYRDINIVIPVIVQLWMYASPIVYPVSLVPETWRFLYGLNPMAGVINGFRWALLGQAAPNFELMGMSALAVMFMLWGGIIYFRRMEPTIADIV
jgi:homopolymeric O-antigen transport system permease protein